MGENKQSSVPGETTHRAHQHDTHHDHRLPHHRTFKYYVSFDASHHNNQEKRSPAYLQSRNLSGSKFFLLTTAVFSWDKIKFPRWKWTGTDDRWGKRGMKWEREGCCHWCGYNGYRKRVTQLAFKIAAVDVVVSCVTAAALSGVSCSWYFLLFKWRWWVVRSCDWTAWYGHICQRRN